MKLKQEYANKMIFIPNIRKTMVGKFIPEGLYPVLYKKYPEFFEVETITKPKKQNALPINDPIITTDNNTTGDNNGDEFVL